MQAKRSFSGPGNTLDQIYPVRYQSAIQYIVKSRDARRYTARSFVSPRRRRIRREHGSRLRFLNGRILGQIPARAAARPAILWPRAEWQFDGDPKPAVDGADGTAQVNVPKADLETLKAMASRTASNTEVDPTTSADLGAGQDTTTK
ncbi:hypothetical protein PPGU19_100240 (plasmid) [Paraburkholderia sp. PGU19]|nr:hypothetical protein PPGU19_100240 [Paraburkholderia sp. PGU19]